MATAKYASPKKKLARDNQMLFMTEDLPNDHGYTTST